MRNMVFVLTPNKPTVKDLCAGQMFAYASDYQNVYMFMDNGHICHLNTGKDYEVTNKDREVFVVEDIKIKR